MSWLTAKQYGIIGLISIISIWLLLYLSTSALFGAIVLTIIIAPPVFLIISLFCMTLKYFRRASDSHAD